MVKSDKEIVGIERRKACARMVEPVLARTRVLTSPLALFLPPSSFALSFATESNGPKIMTHQWYSV